MIASKGIKIRFNFSIPSFIPFSTIQITVNETTVCNNIWEKISFETRLLKVSVAICVLVGRSEIEINIYFKISLLWLIFFITGIQIIYS